MIHAPLISPLISPADLRRAQLDGVPLVVVDCRHDLMRPRWGRDEFLVSRIPGAVHAHLDEDLSAPVTAQTGRHPLPDPAVFAARCRAWGITADTLVVAYDQNTGANAARLWWLLRASGHARVAVLDGGFAAWKRAGLPVDEAPAPPPAPAGGVSKTARAFAGVVETAAELEPLLDAGRVLLIDARPADRFAGQNEVIDPVAGHVPGAVSRPFMQNVTAELTFQPPPALREQWLKFLAGRPVQDVVAMCGSGVTACHNLLALELAGLPGARLYAGSFSEWIRDPSRRIATGP